MDTSIKYLADNLKSINDQLITLNKIMIDLLAVTKFNSACACKDDKPNGIDEQHIVCGSKTCDCNDNLNF